MPQSTHSHLGRAPAGLLIRIDPRARAGLQQQIYVAIRRAILDGVVAPGTQLASSRALADDLCVSRTTTLLAYEQLTAEGYVTTRHGSGTFVAQVLPEDLPARQRAPACDEDEASSAVAARRGPGSDVRASATSARTIARVPARRARSRSVSASPVVAARESASPIRHRLAARLQRPGRISGIAGSDRPPRSGGARHALHRRSSRRRGRSPARTGAHLQLRPRPRRQGVARGARLLRGAQCVGRRGSADRPGAG